MSDKTYDQMTPQERTAFDFAERQREQAEQAELPYKWTQELGTATVTVPLPEGTRGKDLIVEIKRTTLKVQLKKEEDAILQGQLFADVVVDDCSWTIDSSILTIELEKLSSHIGKSQWWPHILTHHPKIDTKKIKPENSQLSDLDPATRGMVEKMMFDNRQKALGGKTSDQIKKEELVEKFKREHPEMDFSNAKLD
ncbi:hypothetical protein L202_05107 [Cryptococcus amylolentus CBS 6039]|uniref:Nuclear movement protein nudC n=2 Tax=Cryptococcus amylolentus TaxID=104669 RepID=A0A1E3HNX1_9TREE|nr:hypothetical protein L202_05107 [Cryptococcus amylolentus CBS 6039]ODN78022.1 hypothetical protein L202_05107 [Cryptococcus amylolentus CBS 6039]ODO05970.1 hypothetical protein I350_05031 [Cryptococcus amylolentus CBS 6273]